MPSEPPRQAPGAPPCPAAPPAATPRVLGGCPPSRGESPSRNLGVLPRAVVIVPGLRWDPEFKATTENAIRRTPGPGHPDLEPSISETQHSQVPEAAPIHPLYTSGGPSMPFVRPEARGRHDTWPLAGSAAPTCPWALESVHLAPSASGPRWRQEAASPWSTPPERPPAPKAPPRGPSQSALQTQRCF